MREGNKSLRIRANTYEDENVLKVHLQQDYDTFEILSLKLTQKNAYKLYESGYGVIVGRVMANGGFGIPNAKVSIFIKATDGDYYDNDKNYLYPYLSTSSANNDGVRYNLLPSEKVDDCHQNVGTFPSKRVVLDNDTVLEVFEDYWKFTTVTNQAGDYMLFGVPTGDQQLHVDLDLSDIGILSQKPYDMIYKGYNENQFESPTKFKSSTDLESLVQIYSQDKGVYVYPFWGDSDAYAMSSSDSEIAVTRADVKVQYEFEPTCVFIGSIVTDTNSKSIGKNCISYEGLGKMGELVTGEGSIEMIRKTLNGQVEELQIQGTRLIDGDGVWCYQIPMNLDYVTTDEYGNMVQTDDPTKGIPTRARVRFRFTLDDVVTDQTNRKRCKYLVPNNPQIDQTDETDPEKQSEFDKHLTPDYEFGTSTWEESYRDLLWNKVYSVKSYIPRIQNGKKANQRKFTGIKMTNHYGSNNPAPYNHVNLKLTLVFRLLCVITKIFVYLITALNGIISILTELPCRICEILSSIGKIPIIGWIFKLLKVPFCAVSVKCIKIDQGFCEDGINNYTYFPGCLGCAWKHTRESFNEDEMKRIEEEGLEPTDFTQPTTATTNLFTCIENDLAQQNEVTSFDFYNDWINGLLYAPLWFRYIKKKKSFLFGLIRLKAKDQWCSADSQFNINIYQPCSLTYQTKDNSYKADNGDNVDPYYDVIASNNPKCFELKSKKRKCNDKYSYVTIKKGLIVSKETMLGQTVYYYKPIEYLPAEKGKKGTIVTLFATDIILLGSLNDCDLDGTPKFYKYLPSSTYNMPTDILFTESDAELNDDGTAYIITSQVESTGADWGNYSETEQCGNDDDKTDGGLFYGIGCSTIEVIGKSCVNLRRICELGVNIDSTFYVQNLNNSSQPTEDDRLVADGFISKDELLELDGRSMFATMNGNQLKTYKDETNGLYRYDFHYMHPENFDGSLYELMKEKQEKCSKSYRYNYFLEQFNTDYYKFRLGSQKKPMYYEIDGNKASMPRYENSFYFYFGLHPGNTAIDKFNSKFYSECVYEQNDAFSVQISYISNGWCDTESGELVGGITLTFGDISTPYSVIVHNNTVVGSIDREYVNKTDDVLYIGYSMDSDPRDSDGNDPLANGNYTITITDNDGNIVQKIVELSSEYLVYETEAVMSDIDNNTLMMTYNNDCDKIREEKVGPKIIVRNVSVDNVLMCAKGNDCGDSRVYTIRLYELVNETDENGYKVTTQVEVSLSEEEIKTGILELCQGDRYYKVVVIELCDGQESGNKVEQIIYVGEPGKFKLYINDVDYDIIQKFHTGYDNPNQQNTGAFKGWDKISQIDNPYYTWPDYIANMGDDLRGTVNNATGELYTEEEIDEEIRLAKEEVITAVKNAFWMTCEGETAEVALTTEMGVAPILFQMEYGKETKVADDNEEDGFRTDISQVFENTQYVFDVEVPTLLRKDSDAGGTIVGNYAMLNPKKKPYFVAAFSNNGADGSPRRPVEAKVSDSKTFFGVHIIDKVFKLYFVAWAWIKDKHIYKVFKPTKDNSGYEAPTEYDVNFQDVSDIIFEQTGGTATRVAAGYNVTDINVTASDSWVTVEKGAMSGSNMNITISAGENDSDNERRATVTISGVGDGGDTGTTEDSGYTAGNYGGFLQGTIYNGITKRVDGKNTFQSIVCGNVIPTFEDDTPVEYEDAMPTERKILGPPYEITRFECLKKEGILRLPYDTVSFDIEDYSSCGLSVDVHANMSIQLVKGYGDKVKNNNTLNVNVINGGEDIKYVLINEYNDKFPFPMFDPCTGAIYQRDVTAEDIDNEGIIQNWDDGLGKGPQDHKYTIDGQFTFDGERAVYVVAYDKDNCRQLSEVYDFSNVYAIIGVTNNIEQFQTNNTVETTGNTTNPDTGESETGTTSSQSSGTTNVSKYGLTVKFVSDQWYLSNYSSSFKVTYGDSGSSNSVSFSGLVKGKEHESDMNPLLKTYVVEIDSSIFNSLATVLNWSSFGGIKEDTLRKLVMVEITDILGITLNCQIKPGKVVEYDS